MVKKNIIKKIKKSKNSKIKKRKNEKEVDLIKEIRSNLKPLVKIYNKFQEKRRITKLKEEEKTLKEEEKQKLKEAMIQSAKLLQTTSFDEIATIINEALKLGTDNDFGYDYLKDFEERWL